MDGIAFSIFGFDVYWYGLIIMMGILVGIVISTKLSKIRGYSSDMILDFILLAVPLGVIGARLYYVVFYWDEFAGHLDRIFTLQMQGLAIYGAVIGGIIAALIMAKWRKMSFWDLLDCAAPSLILAQAMGRWGNFFNQELYGGVLTSVSGQVSSQLALFPPAVNINGEWHLALFLIESVWNLIVFGILMLYWKKRPLERGSVFWLYCGLYASARAILEGMRISEFSLMIFGTIRVSQVASVVIAVFAWIMFYRVRKRKGYGGPGVPERYQLKPEEKEPAQEA
ncbi:MAG: prolipoprotein diacylglyceryl transferase [Christensenellales bacterium]